MSTKTEVTLTCDLSAAAEPAHPAYRTVRLGFGGEEREIDLCDGHAERLRIELEPFIAAARPAGARKAAGPASPRKPVRRVRTAAERRRTAAIRAWALGRGLVDTDVGRIPGWVTAEYDAAHRAGTAELPGWGDLSDLDKGAVLLHLHKREWEGPEYAVSDYPCRYFDHPALTALSPEAASAHAYSLAPAVASLMTASEGDEWYTRLYDAALEADRARMAAERETGTEPWRRDHGAVR